MEHHYHDHEMMKRNVPDMQKAIHDFADHFYDEVEEKIKRGHLSFQEMHVIAETFLCIAEAKETMVEMSKHHKECECAHAEMQKHLAEMHKHSSGQHNPY